MASVQVLFEPRGQGKGVSKMPVYKTIVYTLDISARFLALSMVGKGTRQAADRLIDGYWRRIFQSGHSVLEAVGRAELADVGAAVYMSNHSSLLDIPSLMGAVPGSLRMVTKEELTKLPVWGPALKKSGFIPVDRKNLEKAKSQLEKAKAQLAGGLNVWISPEGTRARVKNRLAKFKKGGFHIAIGLEAPIIPTWIEGAADIIEPDTFTTKHNGHVQVRFGDPIPTAGKTKDDLPALMKEVREAIVALSGRPDPLPEDER